MSPFSVILATWVAKLLRVKPEEVHSFFGVEAEEGEAILGHVGGDVIHQEEEYEEEDGVDPEVRKVGFK